MFLTNSEVNGRKIRKNWAKMAGQPPFVRLGKGYLRIRQNFFSLAELTDRQTCLSVRLCVWGVVVKKAVLPDVFGIFFKNLLIKML